MIINNRTQNIIYKNGSLKLSHNKNNICDLKIKNLLLMKLYFHNYACNDIPRIKFKNSLKLYTIIKLCYIIAN